MYQILHEQLTIINGCYEDILENGKVIYEYLKSRELENVQQLQGEQFKAIQKLENLQNDFEETVSKLCAQFQITEPRVRNLIPYLEEKERIEIQPLYEQILNLDKETQIICQQNGEFLKILLDLSENVIGWLSQYNEEHNSGSQIFIDETM